MTTAAALTSGLCDWLDRLFPDCERGEQLQQALRERFGDDARAVDAELCTEIETAAHAFSRHFALEHVEDGSLVADRDPPGWPPQDPGEVALRAGSVGEVRRLPDGTGVLALDSLDGVHLAAPYLEAAFGLLRGARGVVLDLRRNGGGDPGTVALVLDWLLGDKPTHISDVVYRDRTRQWWTTGRLGLGAKPGSLLPSGGELALPPGTPVAVLISGRTFSSGEALAYHIQSQARARLAGERTPGAADHITPVRVTGDVRAFVPEAVVRDAVTGSNWEGTGVVPDVACEAAEALDAALEVLHGGG
jgi:hypothetical protein